MLIMYGRFYIDRSMWIMYRSCVSHFISPESAMNLLQDAISQLQIVRSGLLIADDLNHFSPSGQLLCSKLPLYYDDITTIKNNRSMHMNDGTMLVVIFCICKAE